MKITRPVYVILHDLNKGLISVRHGLLLSGNPEKYVAAANLDRRPGECKVCIGEHVWSNTNDQKLIDDLLEFYNSNCYSGHSKEFNTSIFIIRSNQVADNAIMLQENLAQFKIEATGRVEFAIENKKIQIEMLQKQIKENIDFLSNINKDSINLIDDF